MSPSVLNLPPPVITCPSSRTVSLVVPSNNTACTPPSAIPLHLAFNHHRSAPHIVSQPLAELAWPSFYALTSSEEVSFPILLHIRHAMSGPDVGSAAARRAFGRGRETSCARAPGQHQQVSFRRER
eukprot:2690566-Rhodomonas_salina.1